MTLATSAKDVKFYRWTDMSYIGAYETPIDCMCIKSISWCCEGEKILVTKSKGHPVIINVPTKLEQQIDPSEFVNITDVTCGTFSHTRRHIAAFGLETGDVYVYDTNTKQRLVTEYKKLPSSIQNLEFSHNDQSVAIGCVNNQIFLLNNKWRPCASFVFPNGFSLSTMSYSKSVPNLLVAGGRDGVLCLWDTETIDNIFTTKDHSGRITDLTFLGSFLASVGTDGKFISYDLRSQKMNFCIELDCPLSSLAYLHGSPELALSTTTGQLRSYDLRNMSSPLKTLVANNHGGIKKIAFPFADFPKPDDADSLENNVKICENDFSASGDFSILSDISNRYTDTESKLSDAVELQKESFPVEVLASPKSTSKPTDLEDFSKLLEEKMKIVSKEFEDKLLQTFYSLRINTSKQFIGLEGKVCRNWNNFVEYLKLSGTDSGSHVNREKTETIEENKVQSGESDK